MNYPYNKAEVVDLLEQHGVLPTLQRMDIAFFLFSKAQHLSADEVLVGVNQGLCKVSKATVYNTLGLFVKKGIVREVLVDPERVFYDTNLSHHYHIFNLDTGELSDIGADQVEVLAPMHLPEGVRLDSLDVVVRVRNNLV